MSDGAADALAPLLDRYAADLVRQVAANLLRSRLQRGPDELRETIAATVANPAVIDRRLRDLDPPLRTLLALLGLSARPRWPLVGVLELASALDLADGLGAVRELCAGGLLYAELTEGAPALKHLDDWLGAGGAGGPRLYAPPGVTARALSRLAEGATGLPAVAAEPLPAAAVREADGLEWLLRLGVVWQQIYPAPLRLTQQGEFFKRDRERLAGDPLVSGPAADQLVAVPDPGPFLVALGLGLGLLREADGEVTAGAWPGDWGEGLVPALRWIWAGLPELHAWTAAEGWRGRHAGHSPYGTAGLLAAALLAALPPEDWADPDAIGAVIAGRHCWWQGQPHSPGPPPRTGEVGEGKKAPAPAPTIPTREAGLAAFMRAFLLGVAFPLRLVQAAQDGQGRWRVRLAPTGRAVLGLAPAPAAVAFPKTLLVQPNLEIVVYRQGLTPTLAAELSRYGTWAALGAACTVRLQPETVYRGLEAGGSLEALVRLLGQHGVRETPAAVLEALRTWANKRERLTVHAAGTLLEFHTTEDADAALGRGLIGLRLAERLVLVDREGDIDYRQFRLVGTRDYAQPPGVCVEVADDGVTLAVDPARADLLLDTEIQRFAEPLAGRNGDMRAYRLTPPSVARGRAQGLSLRTLEEWFVQRTGHALPPAARLLLTGAEAPPLAARTLLVVETPFPLLADGLMQWPETRALIQARLGPQALVVAAENLAPLRAKVRELGLTLDGGG